MQEGLGRISGWAFPRRFSLAGPREVLWDLGAYGGRPFALLFASTSSASLTCILPRRTRLLERECCKRALWEGLKVRGLLSVWPRSRPLPLRAASNVFEVQSSRAPILLDQNSTAAEHKLEKQGRGALVSSMACSWWTLAI